MTRGSLNSKDPHNESNWAFERSRLGNKKHYTPGS